MGREATAIVHWRGATGETKLLLEPTELVLRGHVKDRVPRAAIGGVRRTDLGLALTAFGNAMVIGLSGAQADAWEKALTSAPPSLAQKLGLGPDKRAYVLGVADDDALSSALAGHTVATLAHAAVIVAVLRSSPDLDAALEVAACAPALPLWCVHGKGRQVQMGEAAVRRHLREKGYVDSKSCGVSEQWSATRFGAAKKKSLLF